MKPLDCATAGPDIQQIYIHSVTSLPGISSIEAVIPGVDLYAERALLVARRGDVVCVPRPVEDSYLRFLREQGLRVLPENIIACAPRSGVRAPGSLSARFNASEKALDAIAERIDRDKRLRMNVFILSEDEHALAQAIERKTGKAVTVLGGDSRIVRRVYAKEVVLGEAKRKGIPVAPGEIVRLEEDCADCGGDARVLSAAIGRHLGITGRVIVRGSVSTSGTAIGLFSSCSVPDIENELGLSLRARENLVYLVSPCFGPEVSPNILTFVQPDTGEVSLVGASDQRLDEKMVHKGNILPSRAKNLPAMIRDSLGLSRWLRDLGYTGFAGFDFVEYRDEKNGEPRYFLSELNPRVNGALYPRAVQERCRMACDAKGSEPSAFLSANLTTTARCFAELEERFGDWFFEPRTKKGVFPYNTGRLSCAGHFSAVFLGSCREEVEEMAQEFEARLAGGGACTPPAATRR
ncbi:MAG TPA: hypothetical protein VMZ05_10360 [Spirochaetota bacterium]|nr:hypothetical protein [Spirochaetota bacterium]